MQQKPVEFYRQFANLRSFASVLPLCVFVVGCADRPSTIDVRATRPHEGATLRLAVSDPSDLPLVRDLARSWAIRQDARVELLEDPSDDTADVRLIRPSELPRLAEAGALAEVPTEYQSSSNPYRWEDIFIVNSSRLSVWKSKTLAVPVYGEGMVFAYRTDVYPVKNGPASLPPRNWDEVAARAGAAPGKAMAAWPAMPEFREAIFHYLAASLDRPAINRLPSGVLPRDEFFSFHFDTTTGASRLTAPAFIEAGRMMARLTPLLTPGVDPAESFNKHGASFGIVSLRDLANLDTAIVGKIGIMPLPATSFTLGPKGERQAVPGGNLNRVPYLGWGGRLGVVSSKSAKKEAAWDFWTDAGMPDQQALDLIGATKWGAGPFRGSQIDTRVRPRWLGYRLGTAETDQLTGALRDNIGVGTLNYRAVLRTPNEEEFRLALRPRLKAVIDGTEPAETALLEASAKWTAIIGKLPKDRWNEWLRRSLGL